MTIATNKVQLDQTAAAVYARLGDPLMRAQLDESFMRLEDMTSADIEGADFSQSVTRVTASISDLLDEDLETGDLWPEERAYLKWLAIRRRRGMSRYVGILVGTVDPSSRKLVSA